MWDILHTKFKKKSSGGGASAVTASSDEGPLDRSSTKISAAVNFKDLNLTVDGPDSDVDDDQSVSGDSSGSPLVLRRRMVRSKQVIIMTGLPGRGKTWLCHKLGLYLNWLGHNTKHINVGSYRRRQKPESEVQTADFFDPSNEHGIEARHKALEAALEDLHAYLDSDIGQIVIFDATNSTQERRKELVKAFHGRYQYLFIESICNDSKVLEENYLFKMKYSPDYQGMDTAAAVADFKKRVAKYEQVYEPINDRNVHYIKLIDMVTGRGYMDVNRISGYIPGKIVFFLMQVCKAGLAQTRKIWLTRHGESEYNQSGKIGGDSKLSVRGEEYAKLLPDLLISRLHVTEEKEPVALSVWTSTLKRTIMTADHLPLPKLRWKALDEIQAGLCDGMTYAEIQERYPEEFAARSKDKLRYRYQAGESYQDVIMRLEPVIIEMEREKESICVVSHQAVLRAILGYFMGVPIEDIPKLHLPLHTLIELRPHPDGHMEVEHFPMHIPTAEELTRSKNDPKPQSLGQEPAMTAVDGQAQVTAAPHFATQAQPLKIPFGVTAVSPFRKPHAVDQRSSSLPLDDGMLQEADKSSLPQCPSEVGVSMSMPAMGIMNASNEE